MVRVNDIIVLMEKIAPPMLAENWDNVGLMVGEADREVTRVLIALDAIDKVIEEAIEKNCQMIITHHPLIFKGTKTVTSETALGRRLLKLIQNNIAVYSAHTNLDIVNGGTNDTLAKLLGLNNIENLCEPVFENMALGKVGELKEEISFEELIKLTQKALKLNGLVACGDKKRKIKKIAVGTGACSDLEYIKRAKDLGCDALITSDVGYHDAQNAMDFDICLIDASHYGTEVIIVKELKERLEKMCNNSRVEFIESQIYGNGLEIFSFK